MNDSIRIRESQDFSRMRESQDLGGSQFFEGNDIDSYLENIQSTDSTSISDKQFSESIIIQDENEFREQRKQVEDPDPIDFEDRIFTKTCTSDELKQRDQDQQNKCAKCAQKFNLMNKKHQCKFCGNLVCEQHGRKHREDPSNQEHSFKRICDICEDKYLKRIINMEFKKKKDKMDKMTKQLEEKQNIIIEKKKEKQRQLDELKQKSQEEGSQYTQEQMKYGKKINRIQKEIKSLNYDYQQAKEKLNVLDDQIHDITKRKEEKKNLIHLKKQEEDEINNKVIAIEYDIKEAQYIIDEIEKRITENNLRLEKLKVQKSQKLKQRPQQQEENMKSISEYNDVQEELDPIQSQISQKAKKKKTKGVQANNQQCGVKECIIF